MAEQYISIKVVLDKLHRNPLLSDVSLETVVDYCVDFMRIVGVPRIFIDKTTLITINNFKATLPNDFLELIQIRAANSLTMLRNSSDTFHTTELKNLDNLIVSPYDATSVLISNINEVLQENITYKLPTLRANYYYLLINNAITQVDYSVNETTLDNNLVLDDTFIIQNNTVHSTIETGHLEVAYRAINVDSFGMPMIPDNSNFTRALESYIKKQHYSILYDLGKITAQVYNKTEQEYAWNVGSLETDMRRLDLSKAEAFFNSFRTLFIRDNEFYHGWKNDGGKQILLNLK